MASLCDLIPSRALSFVFPIHDTTTLDRAPQLQMFCCPQTSSTAVIPEDSHSMPHCCPLAALVSCHRHRPVVSQLQLHPQLRRQPQQLCLQQIPPHQLQLQRQLQLQFQHQRQRQRSPYTDGGVLRLARTACLAASRARARKRPRSCTHATSDPAQHPTQCCCVAHKRAAERRISGRMRVASTTYAWRTHTGRSDQPINATPTSTACIGAVHAQKRSVTKQSKQRETRHVLDTSNNMRDTATRNSGA